MVNARSTFTDPMEAVRQGRRQRSHDHMQKNEHYARMKSQELANERNRIATEGQQIQNEMTGRVLDQSKEWDQVAQLKTIQDPVERDIAMSRMANEAKSQGQTQKHDTLKQMIGNPAAQEQWLSKMEEIAIQRGLAKPMAGPPDDRTSKIKEYQYYLQQERAKGEEPLSFNDWDLQAKKAGASNVSVNTGSISPGHEQFRNPETGELEWRIIPGSPADREQKEAQRQQEVEERKIRSAAKSQIFENRRTLGQIRKIREEASPSTVGAAGLALGWIPFTKAGGLQKNIDSLLAKVGFKTLSDMRAESPTGGALGQVSERELEFLQAAMSNLANSQSYGQFMENLDEVASRYERALALLESEYAPESEYFAMSEEEITAAINEKYPVFGDGETGGGGAGSSEIQSLIDKYAD